MGELTTGSHPSLLLLLLLLMQQVDPLLLGTRCHLPATRDGGLHQGLDRLWWSGVLQAKLWTGLQALLAALRLDGGRCTRCSDRVRAQPRPESQLRIQLGRWLAFLRIRPLFFAASTNRDKLSLENTFEE